MIETIQNFHFLRPAWLLLIPLCILVIYGLMKKVQHKESWQQVIDPKLLPFLSIQPSNKAIRWPLYCLGTAWLIATIALAGPTWKKVPQPVSQKHDALVVVLDLSLSMYAQDIKPSRLIRAKYKINDLLKNRHEGLTGLVVYSGQPHAVTPLSDDSDTIINLLTALSPEIMPSFGSNPSAAIQQAIELFNNANISEGQILLITDGISSTDIQLIGEQLAQLKYSLSIIGVATENGAPIPINTGNGSEYLKDRNGNIVMPKLERGKLNALSKRVQGRYTDISLDNRDLNFLLAKHNNKNNNSKTTERHFDTWHDSGALLVLLLLPIAAIAFRRGWLLMLPLLIIFETPTAHAFAWQDLWKTKDQQAMQMMQQEDFNNAASTFKDPAWQASASYKSGDYERSLSQFEQLENNAENLYNQGNALAKMQNYEEAIKRYDQAITQQKDFTAAKENKALLEKLLKQQKQQQSSQQQQGEQNKENQQQDQNGDKQENQQTSSDQQQNKDSSQSGQQNASNKQQNSQGNAADNEEALKDRAEQALAKQQNAEDNAKDKEQQLNSQQAQQEAEKQQKAQQQSNKEEGQQKDKANAQQLANAQKGKHIDHATEQWLRQIPDDPAGLLRRKFYYEYQMQNPKQRTTRESIKW